MVHPFPSVAVAAITGLLALAIDGDRSLAVAFWLAAAMFLFQCAIGIVNDLVDAADDATAKPWKPLPRGCLTRRAAWGLTACCSVAGLAIAAGFGPLVLLLAAAGLGSGLAYDLWLKRTALSWLPLAVALPLLAAWVLVATGEWRREDGWLLGLGPLLGLAIHLANQAPDVEADRLQGVRGMAQRLGGRWSLVVAFALGAGLTAAGVAILLAVAGVREAVLVGISLGIVLAGSGLAVWRGRWAVAFPAMIAIGATLAVVILAALHG